MSVNASREETLNPNERTVSMKKYRMKDPSGDWIETMAKSREKARANFVYRLTRQPYGMFIGDAKDFVDAVEEVPE